MNSKFEPKDLLFMDKMLFPKIVTGLYWIAIICCLMAGVFTMLIENEMMFGIATIILGPIVIRLYTELLIIGFKAYEKLSIIADNYENKNNTSDKE